ncbi:cytochrome b/b6 domain-containing protein [Geomonas sp. Red32]|uniref:cytochrome b/b6 domain-containing protein n=1 Tax=Geomonas sp. Red32 TaxID=2912856 RepID=UPI00202CA86E|nr:cytochrome b/b6 domain-containing protein [Geomonas sp. Red32]MCM0080052.1 cytochrome b/b6 domain-containing protein [Geomonas sp. Red32]
MKEKIRIYLQPIPVRIWHWINAFGIITLIVTGTQIRFPETVQILGSYRNAIHVHNVAGVIVSVSFSFWFFYYKMVKHSLDRLYIPNEEDLKHGIVRQLMFYCFWYFLGRPSPFHATPEEKFNPMQKSAYLAVMFVLMPLVGLTGILLMNVTPLRVLILAWGGLKVIDGLHFLLACSLCAFLFTHVYLATLGATPMAYIKPMLTGWEELPKHDDHHGPSEDDALAPPGYRPVRHYPEYCGGPRHGGGGHLPG